jgi:hypothetical protein
VCARGTDHEGGLTRLHAPIRNNHKTGEKMKTEEIENRKPIPLHCYIYSTQDPELHARFLQLKEEQCLCARGLIKILVSDWVEQQTKEK